MLRTANVKVTRRIESSQLRWATRSAAASYPGCGWNRDYEDYSETSWSDVEATIQYECSLLERHATVESRFDPCDTQEQDDEGEIEMVEYLQGLDAGVASCVLALSAARCLPFSSCNGGVLGDFHQEQYPLVAFFARRLSVPILRDCAETSGAGLENHDGGALLVYADDLNKMVRFAKEIHRRRTDFDKLARPRRTTQNRPGSG
jgi:hypothetical protein